MKLPTCKSLANTKELNENNFRFSPYFVRASSFC